MVTCAYDSLGRRCFKKVTVNGTVTLHHRYLYRGYLQIASIDLTRSNKPALWFITWDPTEPIATRQLAIQKDGTWYTYGLDLTKNVCEVFGSAGYIATTYTYSPYGSVTAAGSVTQPVQWSSEVWEPELSMVYYNWRYYNPIDGRWIRRDDVEEDFNNFLAYENNPAMYRDILGHLTDSVSAYVRHMLLLGCSRKAIIKELLKIKAAKSALEAEQLINRELHFKGERKHTARPDGGNNPYKHTKPSPNDPNSILRKDPQTGKWKKQKKPKDYDQKGGKRKNRRR